MGEIIRVNGKGVTFYIDSSRKTHAIYICTTLQIFMLEFADNKRRDWKKMNKVSRLISEGVILDINGVSGALGSKIVWTPQYHTRKRMLEVVL